LTFPYIDLKKSSKKKKRHIRSRGVFADATRVCLAQFDKGFWAIKGFCIKVDVFGKTIPKAFELNAALPKY